MSKGHSVEGFWGQTIHYDEKGHKIGESWPDLFGGYTNYDDKMHKVGESRPGFFGYTNYDKAGNKVGSSTPGLLGTTHYDAKGHKTGSSYRGIIGSTNYINSDRMEDRINQAGGAAAVAHDQVFGYQNLEEDLRQQDVSQKIESSNRNKTVCSSPVQQSSDEAQKTVHYVIAKSPDGECNCNYRCGKELKVGDRFTVYGSSAVLEVLAVVEVLADEAPPMKGNVV